MPGNTIQRSWVLQSTAQLEQLLAALGESYSVTPVAQSSQRVIYLDTFDWRVWRHGDVLEYHEHKQQKKLLWRKIDHLTEHVEIPLDECPDFIEAIADWLQPKALLAITQPRALVEQASSRQRIGVYDIQDDAEKVVCRLKVVKENIRHTNNRSGVALATRVQIDEMRGYEKVFANVARIAEQSGLTAYGQDPLVRLLQLTERRPCDYSNRLRLQLQPQQRADAAARQILLQLINIMQVNEAGMRKNRDTEHLHDYRHAVQRAHALLKQLKHVIPEDTRQRFIKDLDWINQSSRALFDLNGWLLGFKQSSELLSKSQRPHLDALYAWLKKQQRAECAKLNKLLKGAEYKKFTKRWRVFMECEVPDHSVLKRAEQPVEQVAGRQVWKVYKRLVSHEDANVMKMSHDKLLQMGEACATLGQLLALARTLSPDKPITELSTALHAMQGVLDDCINRQNRAHALRGYIQAMRSKGLREKNAEAAIDRMLNRILDGKSECLKDLQRAYYKVVNEQTRHTYQRLFKPS